MFERLFGFCMSGRTKARRQCKKIPKRVKLVALDDNMDLPPMLLNRRYRGGHVKFELLAHYDRAWHCYGVFKPSDTTETTMIAKGFLTGSRAEKFPAKIKITRVPYTLVRSKYLVNVIIGHNTAHSVLTLRSV